MKTKTCGYCKEIKILAEFSKCKTSKDGFYNYCKLCAKVRVVLCVYGLTPEDHKVLEELQNGRCAICNKIPNSRGLFIDHNHTTGKVRGLLCPECNAGLSMFRENIDSLTAAIAYLRSTDIYN